MGTNERRRKANVHQVFLLVLIVALAVAGLWYYLSRLNHPAKFSGVFQLPNGQITEPLYLEVAASDLTRRKGLMFRKSGELQPNEGMLFVYPREAHLSFWMKDTYISLDMIFLDKDLKVVGVVANTPVLSENNQSVQGMSEYVIELLAGTSHRLGIEAGSIFKPSSPVPKATS